MRISIAVWGGFAYYPGHLANRGRFVAEHHRNRNSAIRGVAWVLSCALALTLLAPPRAANAQDAFSCIEELNDDEVRYRIRYIEDELREGKKHATRWRYTWMGFWLAVGGVTTWLAVDAAQNKPYPWKNSDKFGWAYLAAGSYFVATTHMFVPAPDVWGAKRIRRQDESTEEARRAKLRYATNTLKKSAAVEELMGGAFGVAASLVYGVVGGTVKATQWTGASRGLTAGMYIGPPVLVGLQTATAPRGSVQAYETYRGIACSSKYYDRGQEGPELDLSVSPAGGSFGVRF
jgi:hypothetical protein